MIDIRANYHDARNRMTILDTFSEWSGQEINFQRHGLFFSEKVGGTNKAQLEDIFSMKKLNQDSMYLGNPLFIKKGKDRIIHISNK